MITAVDTNILIDILEPDPVHGPTSRDLLKRAFREGSVVACEVVWAEVATAYDNQMAAVVDGLSQLGVGFSPMSRDAALMAARCWVAFRKNAPKTGKRIVADFLIGGYALVQCDRLLTRDRGFYRRYFRDLTILEKA